MTQYQADPDSWIPHIAAAQTYLDYLEVIRDVTSESEFVDQLLDLPREELKKILQGFVLFKLHMRMWQGGIYVDSNPYSAENRGWLLSEIIHAGDAVDNMKEIQHEASLPQDTA